MASKRIARLNEQLRRELAELVHTSVRDPRVGVVTVTAVKVVPDLTTARVLVRLVGDDAERQATLDGLQAAAPFLRRTLGQMLHVRRIPELRFSPDASLEHAQRIEAILAEVLPPEARDREEYGLDDADEEEGDEDEDEEDGDLAGEDDDDDLAEDDDGEGEEDDER
jgi:ribosome-binding factor A